METANIMSEADLNELDMCLAERYVEHLRGQLNPALHHSISQKWEALSPNSTYTWFTYIERRLGLNPCDRNFVRGMAGDRKAVVRDVLKRRQHLIDGLPAWRANVSYIPFCHNPPCGKTETADEFFGDRIFGYCAACTKADYCGKACQRAHWPIHKPCCLKWQQVNQEYNSEDEGKNKKK